MTHWSRHLEEVKVQARWDIGNILVRGSTGVEAVQQLCSWRRAPGGAESAMGQREDAVQRVQADVQVASGLLGY